MKTKHDPRHLDRVRIIKELFAWNFNNINTPQHSKTKLIIDNLGTIDEIIRRAGPQWPLERVNKIDLAILQQAVYELIIDKSIPFKVVVDEAVELGKEYGSTSTPGFINGLLGKVIEDLEIYGKPS